MRYYVKNADGEKGPYSEEQIRESIRSGNMSRETLLRREDEDVAQVAKFVIPNLDSSGGGGFGAYAPPTATDDSIDNSWQGRDPGSFGQGFVFGFFCGCIALLVSYTSSSMGEETKRGVRTGFAVGFVVGLFLKIIAAASTPSNRYGY